VIDLVQVEYPEVAWRPWRFDRSPRGWWQALQDRFPCISPYPNSESSSPHDIPTIDPISEAVVRDFIELLAQRHGIGQLSDWYRISHEQLDSGTADQLKQLGRLPNVLQWLYPTHEWELFQFGSAGKKAAQRFVMRFISGLFADYSTTIKLLLI